jgi:hypothetical protein
MLQLVRVSNTLESMCSAHRNDPDSRIPTTTLSEFCKRQSAARKRSLGKTAKFDIAACSGKGAFEEETACLMDDPRPLTPPAPEVAETAEDDKDEEEFDGEPPVDDLDQEHDVRV